MGDSVDRIVAIIKDAVKADADGDLAQALQLYQKAVEHFMVAIKYEKNEKSKKTLRDKAGEYLKRAEEIKVELKNGPPKKKAVKSGASKDPHDESDSSDDKGEDPETKKLQAALASTVLTEKPNVKWSDVAGLETAKSLLKEAVILPSRFPQLFTGKRTPWKGILLYGPPGTGKSFLAKAVATEAASTFLAVSSSDLVSKFQGESERLVRSLFDLARAKAPAIVFIDEVDSLCSNRSDGENDSARRIKTEFLVQMQGVGKANDGILVLGATNTPWEIDPAIRRRFEKRVYIPLPDEQARAVMFKLNIGNTPHTLTDKDFADLARRTDGFSGSDISVMVRDALYEPVRICQEATHFKKVFNNPQDRKSYQLVPCRPGDPDALEMSLMDIDSTLLAPADVTMDHFERALVNSKPSVCAADLSRHDEWTKQFGQEA